MAWIESVFIICFVLLQFYYLFFFAKYAFTRLKDRRKNTFLPLSVVICGKNAAAEFAENIPKVCAQEYPEFEVVVVDDHSTDDTVEVVKALQQDYPNIVFVQKENVPDRPGKKAALYTGVSTASHDYVVVTDADCYPASKHWLQHIFSAFKENTNLVLAVSPNEKKRGFWKGLFRFETVQTAMLYVSFALRGMPYMGVGRNMAFKREHFLTHFVQILEDDIASGDDDLLVNFSAKPKTTAVCLHPDSYTYSDSPENFKKWFRQKQRHLSAGFKYKVSHQVLLSLFPLVQLGFFLGGIALLFTPFWFSVIVIFLFQFLIQQVIHSFILRKQDQADLALEYPIYQLMWLFLLPLLAFLSYAKPKTKWN